jgi:hypothetical protein
MDRRIPLSNKLSAAISGYVMQERSRYARRNLK